MTAPTTYAWHVHHEKLYEPLTEPIENRINFIKGNKDQREVALRLKLLRVVKDQKAMAEAVEVAQRLEAGWQAYEQALKATATEARHEGLKAKRYEAAAEGGSKAFQDLKALPVTPSIDALHRQECEPDCPWDGITIAGGWRS